MNATVKTLLTAVADSLGAAVVYALIAAGIYAAVFVDVTGRGALWNTLRGIKDLAESEGPPPTAVRTVRVAASSAAPRRHEDAMLAVFDEQPRHGPITAVYQAPEEAGVRPEGKISASAAPAKPRKSGAKSESKSYTVYGEGERASAAAEGSAARAQTTAAARPGVGVRLSRGLVSGSEASRTSR